MKVMRILIWKLWFIVAIVSGCDRPRSLTPLEAREIADRRYIAHVKAAGLLSLQLPSPVVNYRNTDTVFTYIEPTAKRTIVVIVERSGEVADTTLLP